MKRKFASLTLALTLTAPFCVVADLVAQEGGDKAPPRRGEGGRGEGGRGQRDGTVEGRGGPERGPGRNGNAPGRQAGPGGQAGPGFRGGPGGVGVPGGFDGSMIFGQMMKALPMAKALDADGDGELSAMEIENATKALLTLDANGDGKLSIDELRPNPADMRPGPLAAAGRGGEGGAGRGMSPEMLGRMFEQRDTDGDGVLAGDEIPERLQGMLGRIDKNKDSKISKDELAQIQPGMMERLREKPATGGRRGGGEGDGPVNPRRPG